MRATAAKAPKTSTQPVVDFGTRQDWAYRLNGCVIFHKDVPFLVQEIRSTPNPETLDIKKKLDYERLQLSVMEDSPQRDERLKKFRKLEKTYTESLRSRKPKIEILGRPYRIHKDWSLQKWKDTTVLQPKDLDLSFRPLGLINNADGSVSWASRMAGQQRRHGLHDSNVRTKNIFSDRKPSTGASVSNKRFMQMLLNQYPSLDECLDTLFKKEGKNTRAFDKNFAVSVDEIGHVTLYWRTTLVGMSPDEGETFKLAGRYGYLKESLENAGVKIVS